MRSPVLLFALFWLAAPGCRSRGTTGGEGAWEKSCYGIAESLDLDGHRFGKTVSGMTDTVKRDSNRGIRNLGRGAASFGHDLGRDWFHARDAALGFPGEVARDVRRDLGRLGTNTADFFRGALRWDCPQYR